MEDLLRVALDEARRLGASYADVRVVERLDQPMMVKSGQVTSLLQREDRGFGVRVLAGGGWGFAASADLTRDQLREVARQAVSTAWASALVQRRPVTLSPLEPVRDTYTTPCFQDPFEVETSDRLQLLRELDEVLRSRDEVRVATASMLARREKKTFASTEGSYIEQIFTELGISLGATASGSGDVQRRSFGDQVRGGYEHVEAWNLFDRAETLSREAVQLLTADVCPRLKTDLILGSSQLALQIHESCGPPIELDRVYGSEASFAGTSFLTTDKQGEFRYGSEVVNIAADATVPGGLGTFGYDDEGVPARRTPIVQDGLFVDYLTCRETAATLGQASNGSMLADGWNNLPLVRMTNVSLEPGTATLAEIIEDTRRGIFMDSSKSWSLDDRRLNFHFGTEIAWEIEDGEITRMLKNAAYTDMTPRFWNSCDAVAGEAEWQMWGLPGCAKGEPVQIAHVGHGASPARFRNIKVGVGK